jgi:hypothetical protein
MVKFYVSLLFTNLFLLMSDDADKGTEQTETATSTTTNSSVAERKNDVAVQGLKGKVQVMLNFCQVKDQKVLSKNVFK